MSSTIASCMKALCVTGVGHPAYVTEDGGKDGQKAQSRKISRLKCGEHYRDCTALCKSMNVQSSRAR